VLSAHIKKETWKRERKRDRER